jgi:hypothetical protein
VDTENKSHCSNYIKVKNLKQHVLLNIVRQYFSHIPENTKEYELLVDNLASIIDPKLHKTIKTYKSRIGSSLLDCTYTYSTAKFESIITSDGFSMLYSNFYYNMGEDFLKQRKTSANNIQRYQQAIDEILELIR